MKIKAFTLIELLVVIAIIALLMGILMPALQKVRDKGKQIQCVSRVRTLALGWWMYKGDNDDELVGAMVVNTSWAWARQVPGNAATVEQEIDEAIRKGALYPYVGKSIEVYRCPSDQRMKDPRQTAYRSFSIANGANGENWPDPPRNHTVAKKASDIRQPSSKYIFLEDVDPRGSNVGSWQMFFGPPGFIDPVAMWHGDQTTMGFADGHAESVHWRNPGFIEWCEEAMYGDPLAFQFNYQNPVDEPEDLDFLAKGFPCKSHAGSQ